MTHNIQSVFYDLLDQHNRIITSDSVEVDINKPIAELKRAVYIENDNQLPGCKAVNLHVYPPGTTDYSGQTSSAKTRIHQLLSSTQPDDSIILVARPPSAIASDTDMDEQQQVQLRVITPHLAKVKLTLTLPVPPTQISFIELQRFFEQHDIRSVTNVQQPVLTVTSVDKKRILDTDTVLQQYVSTYPNQPILVHLKEGNLITAPTPSYVISGWQNGFIGDRYKHLYEQCKNNYRLWTDSSNRCYAPYILVHQSSGMGKSRLLAQLVEYGSREKQLYCYYFCFRDAKGDRLGAYPPRSEAIADTVRSRVKTIADWITFFDTIKQFTADDSNTLCGPVANSSDGPSWLNTFNNMLLTNIQTQDGQHHRQLEHQVNASDKLQYLVIMDEVAGLEESFNDMVRALKRSTQIFVVCADTTSKMSELAAPAELHSSFRISRGTEHLFSPYYVLESIDLLRDHELESMYPTCMTLRGMSRFGRPLWSSLTKKHVNAVTRFERITAAELYNLVLNKLTYPKVSTTSVDYKHESYIAAISALLPLLLSPGIKLVDTLVASHLAVVSYVTQSRDRLYAQYTSEPLVSYVAMSFLRSEQLVPLLKTLLHALSQLTLQTGAIGELLAPLLLLISMATSTSKTESPTSTPIKHYKHHTDNATQLKQMDATGTAECIRHDNELDQLDVICDVTTVHKLLTNFGGCINLHESDGDLHLPETLSSGIVNFNHFINIQYLPTYEDLRQAFIRRAAYVARPYQRGTDYFIPILIKPVDSKPFKITTEHMTVMYVQTKLHKTLSSNFVNEATSLLRHENVYNGAVPHDVNDNPYIALYCDFGADASNQLSSRPFSSKYKPDNQYCFARLGHEQLLNNIKLDEQIKDERTKQQIKDYLTTLKDPYSNPIQLYTCDNKTDSNDEDAIKRMFPQMYKLSVRPRQTINNEPPHNKRKTTTNGC